VCFRFYGLVLEEDDSFRHNCNSSLFEELQCERKESVMDWKWIFEVVAGRVKAELSKSAEAFEGELTPEAAQRVVKVLNEAMSAAWAEGFRSYLQSHDPKRDTIEMGGEIYRWKMSSPKEFLTPGGPMLLERNLYQPDRGGECYVPLDFAWGMVGQFATVEVREAVLFGVAQLTPREVEELLKKCAWFHPSASAIHTMTQEMGQWLEACEELAGEVRSAESVAAGTRVLVGSLDGVNVLLAERGPKPGRPPEAARSQGQVAESPTCYKNAMVGCLSYYGEVPQGESCPQRLQCRYVARMPEEGSPTFRAEWEAEWDASVAKLPPGVIKVMLCDAARHLWDYLDADSRYDDCEKLVDFFHTSEHLAQASEALFGKGSEEGKKWQEKHRHRLKHLPGAVESLLRSMDYYASTRKLPANRREKLAGARNFFRNNQHRMDYPGFLSRGLPIGSGPVEAACKTLVKTRMCRSGMHWSRRCGQYVLTLRTYLKSGRWDAMWCHYQDHCTGKPSTDYLTQAT